MRSDGTRATAMSALGASGGGGEPALTPGVGAGALAIDARGVGKIFPSPQGPVEALRGVDLAVADGQFVCLLGPSGCGKSTLLRILAGIYRQSAGEVQMRAASRPDRPANAVVFQEYAIFPWRTVLDNVAFGLEMHGAARGEREEIARRYVDKVGLTRFAGHYPHQLSGGMKQRVALARAFASDPQLLLMDEPFGALDAQTRTEMQEELVRIWEEERKTVVYVTHSLDEAIILGDRIVLMGTNPGHVKHVYPVDLPRPRELRLRTTAAYQELAQQLWDDLSGGDTHRRI
jgi:NitT/TauT family transport system ATP-binding protein